MSKATTLISTFLLWQDPYLRQFPNVLLVSKRSEQKHSESLQLLLAVSGIVANTHNIVRFQKFQTNP